MKRLCEYCNKEILCNDNKRFCSLECKYNQGHSQEAKDKISVANKGKPFMGVRRAVRFCQLCGNKILGKYGVKYCSKACFNKAGWSEESKHKSSLFRKGKRNCVLVVPRFKVCIGCGIEFRLKNKPRKKYCSNKCFHKNYVFNSDTKLKMSLAGKDKTFTPLHRQHLSESSKGKKKSEEAVKKIALALTGRKLSGERLAKIKVLNIGRKHKLESIIAMKSSAKIKWQNPDFVKIMKSSAKIKWQDPEYVKMMMSKNPIFCNTEPELKVKKILDLLHIKYQTQKRMNISHSYLCDFYLSDYNLVIEADGDIWHGHPKRFNPEDIIPKTKMTAQQRWDLDALRTKELQDAGYKVLRFWETDINRMSIDDFKSILEIL